MQTTLQDHETIEAVEQRLRTILPEEYQDCYEDVRPVSMGSAPLKYLTNGMVAWNQIWSTFCDLAMAGGPPHKGTFLEPGTRADIAAHPASYRQVVEEICSGIAMAAGLKAEASANPGWVRVECHSSGMAGWLVRAIVMENISARCDGTGLELPAGPHFRVQKEIKNVITAIAKTCHYWEGHMGEPQRREISSLLGWMWVESPLLSPLQLGVAFEDDRYQQLRRKIGDAVGGATGLQISHHRYADWLSFDCRNIRAAIWMMRALVVSNVLSRREGTALFVPVNPESDPIGERVVQSVVRIHGFAARRGIL